MANNSIYTVGYALVIKYHALINDLDHRGYHVTCLASDQAWIGRVAGSSGPVELYQPACHSGAPIAAFDPFGGISMRLAVFDLAWQPQRFPIRSASSPCRRCQLCGQKGLASPY